MKNLKKKYVKNLIIFKNNFITFKMIIKDNKKFTTIIKKKLSNFKFLQTKRRRKKKIRLNYIRIKKITLNRM